MRRLAQELRDTGRMFATSPAMVFVAVFVLGLAVSTVVQSCRESDPVLKGTWQVSRALRTARAEAVWHGAGVDRDLLRTLAYPRPPKKTKAPEKRATPQTNASSTAAPARTACASLSDLRFPEFNLLIPPL